MLINPTICTLCVCYMILNLYLKSAFFNYIYIYIYKDTGG